MAGADDTLAAATAVLHGLAREAPGGPAASPLNFQLPHPSANGCEAKLAKLPGDSSPAKVAFEKELEALMRRVHHLEYQNVSFLLHPISLPLPEMVISPCCSGLTGHLFTAPNTTTTPSIEAYLRIG